MSVAPHKEEALKPEAKTKMVIAGMGPGGLVEAIKAKQKGYDFVLIEKREHFSREQRIFFDTNAYPDIFNFSQEDIEKVALINRKLQKEVDEKARQEIMRGLTEEQRFLLDYHDFAVPLNSVQRFLLYKLDPTGALRKEGCIRIGHDIKAFDFSNGKNVVKVESPKGTDNIEFDYFIAADGAQRTVSKAFNKAVAALPKASKSLMKEIEYKKLEKQVRAVPQTTTFLRLAPGMDPEHHRVQVREIEGGTLQLTKDQKAELAELGWTLPFAPRFYVFSNAEGTKFYIAGEIPQKIADLNLSKEGKEKISAHLEKWSKNMLKYAYNVIDADSRFELDVIPNPMNDPEIHKANQLKATSFNLILEFTETPCVPLHNNGIFACVGDAFMNANFYRGTGATDAIDDSIAFFEMIERYESTLDSKTKSDILKEFMKNRLKRKEDMMEHMVQDEKSNIKAYTKSMVNLGKISLEDGKKLLHFADEFESQSEDLKKSKQEYLQFYNKIKLEFEKIVDKASKEPLKPEDMTQILQFNLDTLFEKNNQLATIIDKVIDKKIQEEDKRAIAEQKAAEDLKNRMKKTKETVAQDKPHLMRAKTKLYATHSEAVATISAMLQARTDKILKQVNAFTSPRGNLAKRLAYIVFKKQVQRTKRDENTQKQYYLNLMKMMGLQKKDATQQQASPPDLMPKKPGSFKS